MLFKAIFLLSLLVASIQGASIGLSKAAYAGTLCPSGCSWNTSALFDPEIVPTAEDTVDLKLENTDVDSFSITINADVPVSIQRFSFGAAGSSSLNFVLNIKSGNTFAVADTVDVFARATVVVESGASLIVGSSGTVTGVLSIAGTASFGGTLEVQSQTVSPFNLVAPTLALNNGVLSAQTILIDSLAGNLVKAPTLTGTGNITGIVNNNGKFKPGIDDSTPGNLRIDGSLRLDSSSSIYFDIKSRTEFDHVYITGEIHAEGKLFLSPIGNFEPLSNQRFYIMNHTEYIGGYDSVSGTGFSSLFNDKWSIRPDQENTIVVWGSASSLVASLMVVLMCLLASLL